MVKPHSEQTMKEKVCNQYHSQTFIEHHVFTTSLVQGPILKLDLSILIVACLYLWLDLFECA